MGYIPSWAGSTSAAPAPRSVPAPAPARPSGGYVPSWGGGFSFDAKQAEVNKAAASIDKTVAKNAPYLPSWAQEEAKTKAKGGHKNMFLRGFEKFFELLDVPRSAVMATAAEATSHSPFYVPWMYHDKPGDTWKDKFDRHIGFGQILEDSPTPDVIDNNKWAKRGLGLAGDIVMDPLTYVSAGGAHAASAVGRIAEAAKVAEVLGDEAAARVGRLGAVGLTRAEREAAGLSDLGLRFGGYKVPGTTKLSEAVVRPGAEVRAALGDTKVGQAIRHTRMSPADQALADEVLRGGAQTGPASRILASVKEGRGVGREFTVRRGAELKDLLKPWRGKFDELVRDLEAGGVDSGPVREFLNGVHAEANAAGANLGTIDNYYPHTLTDDAKRILADQGTLDASTSKVAGPELMRKYIPGEPFMGQELMTGSAEEMNGIFRAATGRDLFDMRAEQVLPRYIDAIGRVISRESRNASLEGKGLALSGDVIREAGVAADAEKALAAETRAEAKRLGAESRLRGAQAASTYHSATQAADEALTALQQGLRSVAPEGRAASVVDDLDRIDSLLADPVKKKAVKGDLNAARQRLVDAGEILSRYKDVTDPTVRKVVDFETDALRAEALGIQAGLDKMTAEQFAAVLRDGQAQKHLAALVDSATAKIGTDTMMREDLARLMDFQRRVKDPSEWKGLAKAWAKFTNWWKAYATLSPGFHIRNAATAVWNNWVAGVGFKSYGEWEYLWNLYDHNPKWRQIMGPEKARLFEDALHAAEATGGGLYSNEITQALLPASRLKALNPLVADNYLTRANRVFGSHIENRVRGVMAWDAIKKGATVDQAIEMVEKFHFNYADISDFDRVVKQVIPFWMFFSRNVPLQLQMMATRPYKFQMWNNLTRALSAPAEDGIHPSYFDEMGAFPSPFHEGKSQIYMSVDMPFTRISEDLGKITDPQRLLADSHPIIKLLMERKADKQFFSDIPFQNKLQPMPRTWEVIPGMVPALKAVGFVKMSKDGIPLITDKDAYTVEGILPLLGRARRLAPSEERYQQRAQSSRYSFFDGIGMRTNSPNAQQGELLRRKRDLADLLAEMTQRGYIPTDN